MKQKYIFLTCVIYKLWTTPIRGRTLSSSSRDIEDAEPTNAPRLNSSLTPFFSFADVPLCLALYTGGFSVSTKNPRGLFFSADKKGGKINGQHFKRRPIKTQTDKHIFLKNMATPTEFVTHCYTLVSVSPTVNSLAADFKLTTLRTSQELVPRWLASLVCCRAFQQVQYLYFYLSTFIPSVTRVRLCIVILCLLYYYYYFLKKPYVIAVTLRNTQGCI